MTITKAIETLERICPKEGAFGNPVINEATRLGIEALKFYQETRPPQVSSFCPLLPGETVEGENEANKSR